MDYSKLVSVTGMPGLYELVNSKSDGAIVRSLEDKSSHFISSRIHNLSQLESIEVFTQNENVNLGEVFKAMDKSEEKLPDEKDAVAVKKYFEKVYPGLDFEKVYNSDMKKMVKWFAVIKKHGIEIKLPSTTNETAQQETKAEATDAKPDAGKK